MRVIVTKQKHIKQAAELLKEAYFDTLKEAKEHLQKKIRSKECFVAIDNNKVIGLLSYNRDYSHYANYVDDLAVSKHHRRKGIATLLLQKFIDVSKKEQPKKQRYALSSTVISNKASIRLHKSVGFKQLGKIKELHYGKDEIIFGYKLR